MVLSTSTTATWWGIERTRTMTGYTALTNHTYVAAYQAELRTELHRTGASRGRLEAINRLAERWLNRTGTLRATRGVAQPNG